MRAAIVRAAIASAAPEAVTNQPRVIGLGHPNVGLQIDCCRLPPPRQQPQTTHWQHTQL
jgi:hypothetical protein